MSCYIVSGKSLRSHASYVNLPWQLVMKFHTWIFFDNLSWTHLLNMGPNIWNLVHIWLSEVALVIASVLMTTTTWLEQLHKLETARDQAAKDVLTLNVSGAMWGCTQTDVSWSDKNELSFSTNENLGLLSTDQSQVRILNFDISFISDLGLSHETIALIVTTEYYSDYKKYWIYKYLL